MRKNIISLILSILCCYPLASGNQPNVVLIISDDAGYADFGFMNEVTGNTTDILTPELDTLRSQGSLCSVAYTGAVCSPSRGSILTGSYQQRVGYFYNINNALDPADGPDGFANNEVIAFERMKSAGYKTLAIGKWHVGAQADTLNATGNKVVIPGNRPPRQGVDHFFGMLSGSRDYDVPMDDHAFGSYEYRQRGLREMSPGNKDDSLANDVDEEQNSKWAGDVTDAFGLRAREYVTEHANQDYPFFLYVAFNAPHTPMYESSDYDLLNNPNHPNYANFNSMSTVRKKYCSMVYTMDKNIGLLMDRLKDPNNDGNTSDSVYDNTLIIFINDNGGSKKNESVNLPLRGDKGDPHDGGCRVPMLMTGPGISGDSIYDKPIHSMDLIPTMLAHGGNSIPTELMGSNLLDRVKETDSSDPHDYICVAGNNGLGLRKGDWKLVIGTNGVQTLFNTSSDVGEANDLAGDEPAKLDELIKDATNFDVQMDKPRFPSKGSSHETLNYNYSFTFAPNEVTTPSGVDKILIDYDDGDANNGEHDSAVNNGGFESNTATSGNQGKFNQINQWTNLASNGQNINAIRDNNTSPNGGGWNAVLSDANPASKDFGIDTGHSLTAGENFTVDYAWLDASSWVDSDKIRFQLFTTNDNAITGTQNIIHTEDSSSSTNLAYKTENFTFTAPSGVDGKTLFLRFFALDGNASTGFARVDNIFVGRLGSDQTQTEPQFWAGSDQWQDPSSASDTLLVTDSCALSTLVFPAESNFDYIAQNNLTRYTGLEFIQNTLSFTGNGSNSGKTAKISGNDIILAENYTNDTPPSINFNGDGDGYTFDLALDILLYHDTVIEGDGTATYLISGELKDYDNAVSLTKNGSSTLTLAHDATYSGNTIINGGMLEINPGITLAGSPQVQVSAGASLSGNGSVSGNVVGTGTLAPGQSIGTLAIAGDAQAGTLLIEIAANDADRMNVAGALDVSSMNLEITSLATPAQDTYIIASYGTLNGTFASITGVPNDYQILYTYDDSGSTNHIALAKINNVPNIDAIADQGNTTLDSVNLQASASDDDTADTLTFSATGLPAGLLINPSTGLISGTISSGAETGSAYSVVVTVTDNGSPAQSAEASFTWDVVAFNNAPTITPITTQANITKDVVSLPVNASDDVGDTLTYSASGLPSGLSINNASGLIFGTISDSAADASPYSITVIVTDNGSPTKNAQTSFAWNVTAFNNAPTITAISDQTGITKDVISLSVSASDSDGDTLSYIATGLPSGLSIDSSTGLISGTISDDAGDNSSYSVTITVTDDGAKSAQALFTWNVSTFNNAPTITAISDQTNITKDVVSIQVSALDSDDDTLSYSATGLPSGLSIDSSTGLISGTISDDAGDNSSYSVTITVTDDGAKSAQALFTWNVSTFNNAPTITAISDQTNITKDVVSIQVSALDSDDDTLSYSATGLPSGLSIDSSTGLISGTISDDAGDNSSYSVTITVTDDGAKSAQALFTWNVSTFNNAPTITAISDQTNITKDVVSIQVSALDSDDDTLSYSATGLPTGLSIGNDSGIISGTISDSAAVASPYSVTIIVADDGSPAKNAQTSFTWIVSAFNNAPTITSISGQTNITKDVIAGLSVIASDADDDDLSYNASGLPSGLSIGDDSGIISGTIADDAADSSPYSVTITVSDDGSPAKNAETSFAWNVTAFNNAPTITAISDQTNITKDVVSIQVSALDSDDDTLSYIATGLPSGLSIDSSTGLISGTISDDAGDNSPYSVTVTVTDDRAKSAQALFTWNVSTFNNAPTITAISDQTDTTKDVISLQVSAADSDGDTLSYSATGLPSGLSIDLNTGLISGTISDDAGDNSPYSVTVTVTDDGAKSAQALFTWNVSTFNNAPTITAISDQTNITKDVVSIQVSALDSDDDTLSYSATGLPSGLSIDSSTGLISGTISDDAGDNSSYSVTITVTDDGAKSAQALFTWNVSTFNNAPTITAISDQTNITKDVVSIQVSALDSDDDTLSYSATGLPTGLAIASSTGLISGTISDDTNNNSPYSITITVTDNGSPSKNAETSFTWFVTAFNNAPTITAISDQTNITKDVVSVQVSALDNEDDTLSYSASGLPSGLAINSSSGLISGTISDDADNNSPYNVTITVTDNGDPAKTANTSLVWIVNNPPDTTPPTADLVSPADGDSIDPEVLNAQGYLEVKFLDVGEGVDLSSIDGDELSLSGLGVGTATLIDATPTLVSSTTFRYGFTGSFMEGNVVATFEAGNFRDLADKPNVNSVETENFTVTPAFSPLYLDFGTSSSSVESGHTRMTSSDTWNGTLGWQAGATNLLELDRAIGSDLHRDFNYLKSGTFSVAVPDGTYDVTVTLGDMAGVIHDQMGVFLEGAQVDTVTTVPGDVASNTYMVTVSDGVLDVMLDDLGGNNPWVMLVSLEVVAAGPPVTNIVINDVSLPEGSGGGTTAFTFTLSLEDQLGSPTTLAEDVTAEVLTSDVSAVVGSDYTALVGQIVTITAGTSSTTFNVAVGADDTEESDETFEINLVNALLGGVADATLIISDELGIGTIEDDDTPPPAFSPLYLDFGTSSSSVESGHTRMTSSDTWNGTLGWQAGATNLLELDRAIGSDLHRDFNYLKSGTFSVAVPDGTYDVTVTLGDMAGVIHDQMGVFLEGAQVDTVTTVPGDVASNTYMVTVSDGVLDVMLDDLGGNNPWVMLVSLEVVAAGPPVTNIVINDVSLPEGSGGGTTAFTFTLSLEDQLGSPTTLAEDVTAEVLTSDVSAVVGSDYTALVGQIVTITAGTSSTTFNVAVGADDTEESDETFEINLVNALLGGVADATLIISDELGIGTIEDDDTPPPAFSPLYLDFGTSSSSVESGHTRMTSSDTWNGTLGWQAGATNLLELDRAIGSDLHRDFNYLKSGTFSVAVPDGTYDVTVTLGDMAGVIHDQMGVFLEGAQVDTVTTVPGDVASNTYMVTVSDGVLDVMLDDLGGNNPWVMLVSLEVVAAGPPVTNIVINDVSLPEGSGGGTTAFTFTLSLEDQLGSPTTLAEDVTAEVLTSDVSAVVGSDYTALVGQIVTITAGTSSTTFNVAVGADDTEESDETFEINLVNALLGGVADATLIISDELGIGTIEDDDTPPPAFSPLYLDFGTSSSSVESGHTRMTSSDTWNGTLGWQAGATNLLELDRAIGSDLHRDFNYLKSGTFSVAVPDGTYDVTVTLGDMAGVIHDQMGVFLEGAQVDTVTTVPGDVASNTYMVTVSDGVLDVMLDDLGGNNPWVMLVSLEVVAAGPPVTNIVINDVSLPEGSGGGTTAFTFTLSLEDQLGSPTTLAEDVTAEVLTSDVSAVVGSDYTALVGQIVTITAGTSSTTFNVAVGADDTEESDETFEINLVNALLGGVADATLIISDELGIGTIEDDDTPPPAFSPLYLDFGTSSSSVESGHTRMTSSDTWNGTLGWQAGATNLLELDRAIGSDLHRDFNYLKSGTFSVAVPDGTYDVTVTLGDMAGVIHDQMGVFLEGAQVDTVTTVPGDVASNTYMVTVSDGVLDVMLDDLGGNNPWVMLVSLEVVAAGPPVTNIVINDVSLPEGSGGGTTAFTFTLSLEDQLGSPTTLAEDVTAEVLTSDVSAVVGSDYTALVGQIVTITAGTSSTTFNVAVGADDTEESDETFEINLVNALLGGVADATLIISDELGIGTIEDDDTPPPAFSPLYLDFGTSSSSVESGHTRMTSSDTWNGTLGWQAGATNLLELDRAIGSDLHRDFNYLKSGTFSVAVPDGTYDVTVTLGDMAGVIHDQMGVFLEGAQVDTVTTVPGDVASNTYMVTVSDGVLDVMLDDLGGNNPWVMLVSLEVVAVSPAINTIESLSKLSITESSAINANVSDQLALGGLAGGSVNNTTATDSDSNGMADHEDLFPDNPNLTKISDYINYIADYITDDSVIFDEDWKEQDHNTQFTADLEALLELVFAAEAAEAADQAAFFYLQAFERVDEKLIPRTDGFQEGGSHETDWIIIKEAQDIVYPDLLLLSEYLWLSTR